MSWSIEHGWMLEFRGFVLTWCKWYSFLDPVLFRVRVVWRLRWQLFCRWGILWFLLGPMRDGCVVNWRSNLDFTTGFNLRVASLEEVVSNGTLVLKGNWLPHSQTKQQQKKSQRKEIYCAVKTTFKLMTSLKWIVLLMVRFYFVFSKASLWESHEASLQFLRFIRPLKISWVDFYALVKEQKPRWGC